MAPTFFPNVSQFPIVASVSFYVQDANYAYATWQGNFNENPSMRALAKTLRARASEHLPNFCEQFEQRANFCEDFQIGWAFLLLLSTFLLPVYQTAYQTRHNWLLAAGNWGRTAIRSLHVKRGIIALFAVNCSHLHYSVI